MNIHLDGGIPIDLDFEEYILKSRNHVQIFRISHVWYLGIRKSRNVDLEILTIFTKFWS